MGADRSEHDACAHGTKHDLHELAAVLKHHGDVIALGYTPGSQQMGDPVGGRIELGIGHDLTG